MFSSSHESRLRTDAASRRARWAVWGAVLVALAVLAHRGFWHFHLRRFAVVRPGVLYRSGQPTAWGLQYLINRYRVRTVVSLRGRSRRALRRGLTDLGTPDGPDEAGLVESLGARYLHWPMGRESYWPWLPPAHFERFFQLLDDPRNYPVAVHCIAGKHRTGTFVALYRLEYDRWNAEAALLEMQRFGFGPLVLLQEHNLRTYWARPRPGEQAFARLRREWAPLLPPSEQEDYPRWIARLRQRIARPRFQRQLRYWVQRRSEFSLCVAHRLVDRVDEPTRQVVVAEADRVLRTWQGTRETWATAAALVADYGTPEQQQRLLQWLRHEAARKESPNERYHAVVLGVTNRYTMNRFPYWHAMLEDFRPRREPECRRYRYRDTAAARIFCTIPERLVPYVDSWQQVHHLVRQWLQSHPETLQLRRLSLPPTRQAARTNQHLEKR